MAQAVATNRLAPAPVVVKVVADERCYRRMKMPETNPARQAPQESAALIKAARSDKVRRVAAIARAATAGFAMAVLMGLAACSGSGKVGPAAIAGLTPDGTVDMNQVQAAYIGSAGGGNGTLLYQGRPYRFTVGGLGVGGIGVSTIDAQGEVYKLKDISQFSGAYAQGRYGIVIGTASTGDLWLQNEAGVIMHLKAKRTGLMLSLGGDAVMVSM
jgi:hypothetical protein